MTMISFLYKLKFFVNLTEIRSERMVDGRRCNKKIVKVNKNMGGEF